jgi:hypothetical protein
MAAEKSLYDVCETLKANSDRNTALLTTLNASVLKLNSMMGSFLDVMKMQRMDMLEAMRENKSDAAAAAGTPAEKPKGGSNIALILAGIAALASGFLEGIKDSIKALAKLARLDKVFDGIKASLRTLGSGMRARFATFATSALKVVDDLIQPLKTFFTADGGGGKFVKGLRDTFKLTFTGAAKIFDDLIQPFKSLLSAEGVVGQRITKLFNGLVDIFKFPFEGVIDNVVKPFRAVFAASEGPSVLSRIIGAITRPFTAAIDFVKGIVKPIATFFGSEGPIAKAFGVIKSAFSIFNEGSALMKGLAGIGKVIGRLFFPITLIMTAYDTIKGALAGFEDDGVLGAIQGAITGLLNSVIGMPLDLLKDLISWTLEKFGFKNASKSLDSFSFTDLFSQAIDGVFDLFKNIINGVIELVASAVESIPGLGSAGESIRSMKFDTKVQEKKRLDADIEEASGKQAGLKKYDMAQRRKLAMIERQAMEDGKISSREQRVIDREKAKVEKSSTALGDNTAQLEELRAERAAMDGNNNLAVDQSSTTNTSQSTQPLITTPPSAFDAGDPMLNGA